MPSMLVPNQDQLVTMLPKTASSAIPFSRTSPAQRAWRMTAFQRTMRIAPFSLGSHPQNRPQDWSAQMPPRIVPTKLDKVAKHTTPYIILPNDFAVVSSNDLVNKPRRM